MKSNGGFFTLIEKPMMKNSSGTIRNVLEIVLSCCVLEVVEVTFAGQGSKLLFVKTSEARQRDGVIGAKFEFIAKITKFIKHII